MKVYIVIEDVWYHEDNILSVHANESDAQKEVDRLRELHKNKLNVSYDYQPWEVE